MHQCARLSLGDHRLRRPFRSVGAALRRQGYGRHRHRDRGDAHASGGGRSGVGKLLDDPFRSLGCPRAFSASPKASSLSTSSPSATRRKMRIRPSGIRAASRWRILLLKSLFRENWRAPFWRRASPSNPSPQRLLSGSMTKQEAHHFVSEASVSRSAQKKTRSLVFFLYANKCDKRDFNRSIKR